MAHRLAGQYRKRSIFRRIGNFPLSRRTVNVRPILIDVKRNPTPTCKLRRTLDIKQTDSAYLVGVFRLICRTASVEARLALDAVVRDRVHVTAHLHRAFHLATRRLHGVFMGRRSGEHVGEFSRRQDVDSAGRQVAQRRSWRRMSRRDTRWFSHHQRRIFWQSGWFVRSGRRRHRTL